MIFLHLCFVIHQNLKLQFEYLNIVLFIPQLPDFITINNQLD